jgi:hypothetical protein
MDDLHLFIITRNIPRSSKMQQKRPGSTLVERVRQFNFSETTEDVFTLAVNHRLQ